MQRTRIALLTSLFCGFAVFGLPDGVLGQDLDPDAMGISKRSPVPLMQSLRRAETLAADPALSTSELKRRLAGIHVEMRADEKVLVEIVAPKGTEVPPQALVSRDGEITGSWRNYLEAWVPVDELSDLALALPEGSFVTALGEGVVVPQATESQGPAIMNSAGYRDAGFDGTGITIAVIDVGFDNLTEIIGSGDAPGVAQLTQFNYTSSTIQDETDGSHGSFCLDVVYDHAPGATYLIFKIDGVTDLGNAVDDCIGLGVDVISHSLGFFSDWDDDTGGVCDAANAAAEAGILFCTSAGNYGNAHYQGNFADNDDDGFMNFEPDDETINIIIPAGETVSAFLQWNPAGDGHDYDFYLLNFQNDPLDISDGASGNSESVSWENITGADQLVKLAVLSADGDTPAEFEIYGNFSSDWQEHIVSGSSTIPPSNASHGNVLSVGAVEQASYGAPLFTDGIEAAYSSHGPTNGLFIVPDLAAPTSTTGALGTFIGTSCSAPHAAGLIAAAWSANPGASGASVRAQIIDWATDNDWGIYNNDVVYGFGGTNFPPFDDCNDNDYPDAFDILLGEPDTNDNNEIDYCEGYGYGYELHAGDPPFDPIGGLTTFNANVSAIGSPIDLGILPGATGCGIGVGHDSTLVNPTLIKMLPDLEQLNGGFGPDFFAAEIHDDGITVDAVFGTDPTGAPIELPFSTASQLVCIVYEGVSTTLIGDTVPLPTTLAFVDDLGGSVPVPNGIATTSGPLTPFLDDLEITLLPVTSFEFALATEQYFYDPTDGSGAFAVPATIDNGDDTTVEGFSMSLAHDGALLVATSVQPSSELEALNGGNGPDFFVAETLPAGATTSTVFGGVGMTFPTPREVVAFHYQVVPPPYQDNDEGVGTMLSWQDDVGGSGSANRVVVGGVAYTPNLEHALLQLSPLPQPEGIFRRGDVTANGVLALDDGVFLLGYMFLNGPEPSCLDTADFDDNGGVSLGDAVGILDYLFNGGSAPAAPGPLECGVDPTDDSLGDCDYGNAC